MFKNTQTLNWWTAGLDWMDLSQNITPPRAPCGANNDTIDINDDQQNQTEIAKR